jgi:acetyl esterase/lipase
MKIASAHGLAFLFSLTVMAGFTLPAHSHETLLLWPEDPELNSADGMGTELEKRGKMRMQGVKSPHLRLYPAPKSSQPTPAILHVPGGGYKTCVTGIHEPIAAWFAEQGIRPFMLIYRCPAEKDAKEPLQDIQRAIRILRAHAKKWNIDPDRIGVIGSSAGGNLSVRASPASRIHINISGKNK